MGLPWFTMVYHGLPYWNYIFLIFIISQSSYNYRHPQNYGIRIIGMQRSETFVCLMDQTNQTKRTHAAAAWLLFHPFSHARTSHSPLESRSSKRSLSLGRNIYRIIPNLPPCALPGMVRSSVVHRFR